MTERCTVPIFPLDGVFLCPGLLLPLHVFEPRYQDLLAYALEHDQRIAMTHPGLGHSTESEYEPPVHEVCGLGEIIQHQALGDGRANILLRGRSRLRIVEELTTDEEFRLVHAEFLPEILPANADLDGPLEQLLAALSRLGGTSVDELRDLPPQQLIDSALVGFPFPLAAKLALFSQPRIDLRLRELLAHLPQRRGRDVDIGPDDPRRN